MKCLSLTISPYVSLKYLEKLFHLNYSVVADAVEAKDIITEEFPEEQVKRHSRREKYFITVRKVIEHGLLHESLKELVQNVLNDAYRAAHKTAEYIHSEESIDITINI